MFDVYAPKVEQNSAAPLNRTTRWPFIVEIYFKEKWLKV